MKAAKTVNTESPISTRSLSDDQAAWLGRGQTLGRVWSAWRGRIKS